MKHIQFLLFLIAFTFCTKANAQTELNDYGKLVINTYVPDQVEEISMDVKSLLQNKLNQIVTAKGIGGVTINPRFVLLIKMNILTKDIIAGPPTMIAQNLELNFYIADAIENTIFSSLSIELKGVGASQTKAYIDAIKNINPKDKRIGDFVEEGKKKIIDYYNSNCEALITNANSSVKTGDYDAAILKLSAIPDVCEKCYEKSLATIENIYQKKIDLECAGILKNAKYTWQTAATKEGAQKVAEQLNNLSPFSSCQNDADLLLKQISQKLKADENAALQLKMKKYNDGLKMKQDQIKMQEDESKRVYSLQKDQQKQQYALQKADQEAGGLRGFVNSISKLKMALWRTESNNYIAQNTTKDYSKLKIK